MTLVRRLLFVIAAGVCITLTIRNLLDISIDSYGTLYIVDKYEDTYYEMLSDNVGITTPNGISNVYTNMKLDGYNVYNEEITDKYIDVSFVKDGCPSYRYYYEHPSGKITFFCSEYENSFTGVAYIIDNKEKETNQ